MEQNEGMRLESEIGNGSETGFTTISGIKDF